MRSDTRIPQRQQQKNRQLKPTVCREQSASRLSAPPNVFVEPLITGVLQKWWRGLCDLA